MHDNESDLREISNKIFVLCSKTDFFRFPYQPDMFSMMKFRLSLRIGLAWIGFRQFYTSRRLARDNVSIMDHAHDIW